MVLEGEEKISKKPLVRNVKEAKFYATATAVL